MKDKPLNTNEIKQGYDKKENGGTNMMEKEVKHD